MTIQLKPEQEHLIGQAIQAGLIQAPGNMLDVGVKTIRQRLEQRDARARPANVEQWSREYHSRMKSHS